MATAFNRDDARWLKAMHVQPPADEPEEINVAAAAWEATAEVYRRRHERVCRISFIQGVVILALLIVAVWGWLR